MATAKVGNITFSAGMFGTPKEADPWKEMQNPAQAVGLAKWGIRRKPAGAGIPEHDVLWILCAKMQFDGLVSAAGGSTAEMEGWRAGLIQTIVSSERSAEYAGANHRKFRYDVSFGALKDGQYDTILYRDQMPFVAKGQSSFLAEVSEDDTPNFELPLEFTGDISAPFGASQSPLVRTSGKDEFVSFLAVVHAASHTIVTLGRCKWSMAWSGTFAAAPKIWTPTTTPVYAAATTDESAIHENLTSAKGSTLPFSVFLAEAEDVAQIFDPQKSSWVACDSKGIPDGHKRKLARWIP